MRKTVLADAGPDLRGHGGAGTCFDRLRQRYRRGLPIHAGALAGVAPGGARFQWRFQVERAGGARAGRRLAASNPNFDVALSEAWIAVDDTSCTLITLPEIKDRYSTIEIVNGWGEVTDNVNERTYLGHPSGTFALCLDKAKVTLPAGAQRVEVAGNTARILISIGLGADPAGALALQKQITMTVTGSPKIDDAVVKPDFTDDKLPGVEAFDKTDAILASEADINKNLSRAAGHGARGRASRGRPGPARPYRRRDP